MITQFTYDKYDYKDYDEESTDGVPDNESSNTTPSVIHPSLQMDNGDSNLSSYTPRMYSSFNYEDPWAYSYSNNSSKEKKEEKPQKEDTPPPQTEAMPSEESFSGWGDQSGLLF